MGRGNKMKLQNLLKVIGHYSYTVMLQMDNLFPSIEIQKEKLKDYLDYPVLFVTEDWVITIKGARLV